MQDYYKILNLTPSATDEEIETAYKKLKERYSRERFYEGEIGNDAAKMLTKVETAYHEIMAERSVKEEKTTEQHSYLDIEELIKKGDISGAQAKLDDIYDRNAEWHYLQSVVFYKKNWINESKKQLEIALSIEPHNVKYSEEYAKLKQKIEYNERQFRSGNVGGAFDEDPTQRQMGDTGANNCLSFCATWCCINSLCNMCC